MALRPEVQPPLDWQTTIRKAKGAAARPAIATNAPSPALKQLLLDKADEIYALGDAYKAAYAAGAARANLLLDRTSWDPPWTEADERAKIEFNAKRYRALTDTARAFLQVVSEMGVAPFGGAPSWDLSADVPVLELRSVTGYDQNVFAQAVLEPLFGDWQRWKGASPPRSQPPASPPMAPVYTPAEQAIADQMSAAFVAAQDLIAFAG